ncbi:unnamed protein product [Prorocentrum cordatum]|uniref:Asparagine synthetase domain-containing protein n=1 Tax=Prorocentrum cordatum TaxID=2364126 RepID=A0ABN9VKB2_9DINO|nr:unnamed protein product [Polarella glacialis]
MTPRPVAPGAHSGADRVVPGVVCLRCRADCVELELEGGGLERWSPASAEPGLLAGAGCAFWRGGADAPLAWSALAAELGRLSADADAYGGLVARLHGFFWFVHVRGLGPAGPLCLLAATDAVGLMPLWLSADAEACAASPHRCAAAASGVGAAAAQMCPRVVRSWTPGHGGLSASRPRSFHGLHSPLGAARAATCEAALRDVGVETANADPAGAMPRALGGRGGGDGLLSEVVSLLESSLRRCIPRGAQRVGVLFSGGLDSSLLAWLCTQGRAWPECKFVCYTVGFHDSPRHAYPEDLSAASAAAEIMSLDWRMKVMTLGEGEKLLREAAPVVADWNAVKAEVSMTNLAAYKLAAADGTTLLLSGLGSEEAFSGYHRHGPACAAGDEASTRDRSLGLAQMYHRDLQRDFALASLTGVQVRFPYLDDELVSRALTLPAAMPASQRADLGADDLDSVGVVADGAKSALRAVAQWAGAPTVVYTRRKRASQYGARSHQALGLLAARQASSGAAEPAAKKYQRANFAMGLPGASHGALALLFTSGKDSANALVLHRSWHNPVACVVPPRWEGDGARTEAGRTEALAAATAIGAPLLDLPAAYVSTNGGAPYDASSLMAALRRARDDHGVEGVTCGHAHDLGRWSAVVEACDSLGLRAYAPLWGNTQATPLLLRMAVDGSALVVTRFPDAAVIGQRVATTEEAKALLSRLRDVAGPDAPEDSDAGLLDAEVVHCALLGGGVGASGPAGGGPSEAGRPGAEPLPESPARALPGLHLGPLPGHAQAEPLWLKGPEVRAAAHARRVHAARPTLEEDPGRPAMPLSVEELERCAEGLRAASSDAEAAGLLAPVLGVLGSQAELDASFRRGSCAGAAQRDYGGVKGALCRLVDRDTNRWFQQVARELRGVALRVLPEPPGYLCVSEDEGDDDAGQGSGASADVALVACGSDAEGGTVCDAPRCGSVAPVSGEATSSSVASALARPSWGLRQPGSPSGPGPAPQRQSVVAWRPWATRRAAPPQRCR